MTALVFLAGIAVLLKFWAELPDRVPIYFNWPAKVDGMAGREVLWESLVLSAALCLPLFGLAGRPGLLTFPAYRGTAAADRLQQRLGCITLQAMALLIALTWSATTLVSVSEVTGKWGMDPDFLYPAIPLLLIGTPLGITALSLYVHWTGLRKPKP